MKNDLVKVKEKLDDFKGMFVAGINGYKLQGKLPRALFRLATKHDLVRQIGTVWYIRGQGDWGLPADRKKSLVSRIKSRLRASRPMDDAESREYWTARGGKSYDFESYADEWLEGARSRLESCLKVTPGVHKVLEIGCGAGRNLDILAGMGARVFGVDFSATQLKICKEKAHKVALATARSLPFHDNEFDLVFFYSVILHIPPPIDDVMSEAIRVTRRYIAFFERNYSLEEQGMITKLGRHCFAHDFVGLMKKHGAEEVRRAQSSLEPECYIFQKLSSEKG